MASLMIGGDFFFLIRNDHGFAFCAHHHLVFGLFQQLDSDLFRALSRRHQSSLVDQILEICAGEARCAACDHFHVHRGGHLGFLTVDVENHLATFDVRNRHHHLAVKTAWPEQGWIEHVGPVGSGDDDHALVGVEAVHLDQELVESLLALVMAATQACSTMPPDRINLVNKDDAGRIFDALVEQVTHP